MRVIAFAAVVLGVPLGAETPSSPTVGLFVDFEQKPARASLQALETETAALLQPSGITPAWRALPARNQESFTRMVVVKFKGGCRPSLTEDAAWSLYDPLAAPVRLAATKVANGDVLPWAEVECDPIKQAIAKLPPKQRAVAFGQALARVLAHELYHILARTTTHAREGLAKPVVDFRELPTTTFAPADLRRMRNSLR